MWLGLFKKRVERCQSVAKKGWLRMSRTVILASGSFTRSLLMRSLRVGENESGISSSFYRELIWISSSL